MKARQKINFITIAVENLQRSVEFYKSVFGFTTKGIQEGNEEHCLIELDDNFMLVLYRRREFLQLTANPKQQERSAGFILSHNARLKRRGSGNSAVGAKVRRKTGGATFG